MTIALCGLALSCGCTGTIGESGGSYDVRTSDAAGKDIVVTPPGTGWLDSAWLDAAVGARQAFLTWDGAEGDVLGYRVFIDGQLVGSTTVREYLAEGLEPATTYSFAVEAGYADDLWTQDGPRIAATTESEHDPGFRRLTKEQFNRTMADLHGAVWSAGCAATNCSSPRDGDDWYRIISSQGWGYWDDYMTSYPADIHTGAPGQARGGYKRLDQVVYDEHIAHWTGATMEMAGDNYEDWIGKNLILDPCMAANNAGETNFGTTDEVYQHCMSNFVDEFGRRAFRRPLTGDEHASFMAVYDATGTQYASEGLTGKDLASRGLRNVIAVIMSSPEFLYRVELGDDAGDITPYELASRLSYHFWNTMPDDELFAAAADGSLMTEAGYAAQVERLAGSPRAITTIDEFYRDFFRVQDFPDIRLQDGPSTYHAGPSSQIYGGYLGGIREAMQDEVVSLGVWFTATEPGSYEAMFRSNLHFLKCQERSWLPGECVGAGPWSQWAYGFTEPCVDDDCPIDGGPGWDGQSAPVTLPESERAGLLTRLALLGHDTVNHRPIRRGLYIREALLCDPVPPPENCDVVKPPELDVYMTVREKVEAITEQEGTSCLGCHGNLINGFGHALSHFSSKGQYWEKERMFTDQTNSEGEYWWFLAEPEDWADIDASGTTFFNGEQVTINGAHELADVLAESGQMEWCWSREYFRFAVGRIETGADSEAIEDLANQLRGGSTLAEAYKAIAFMPQFRTLQKAPPAPPEEEGRP